MRGIVLNFEASAGRGVIRGEDGKRYSFIRADWLTDSRPTVSDPVDFEPIAELATDIYLVKPTVRPADALKPASAAPDAAARAAVEAAVAAPRPSRARSEGTASRFLTDWTILFSFLSLLAIFLPYVSLGFGSVSLLDAAQATEQVGILAPSIVGPEQDPAAIVWSLRLVYLLYAIPLLAALTFLVGAIGWNNRRLAFWHGLLSILLPIAVPLALVILVAVRSGREITTRGLGFSPGDISFFDFAGIGFWVIIAIGVAQLATLAATRGRASASLPDGRLGAA
ncbi:MAG TPA: hypothetical protein VFB16_13910 [Bauldia sp.]|nr:hypothetical protein [Bauldia sp.]